MYRKKPKTKKKHFLWRRDLDLRLTTLKTYSGLGTANICTKIENNPSSGF